MFSPSRAGDRGGPRRWLHPGVLAAAVTLAVAAWLSLSLIVATGEGPALTRVAFVRPFRELVALILLAVGLALWARPPLSRVLPCFGAALLLLPWLPGTVPAAFMLWTDGLVVLVWMAVVLGVIAAWGARIDPASRVGRWARDARRAPLVAATLALLLFVSTAWLVSPRRPGGDEPHYLVITQSILDHGHLRIEQVHREEAYREYYPGDLKPHFLRRGQDQAIYSIHAPGLAVLVLPAFALAGYHGVVAFLALIAALGTGLAWRTAFLVTGSAGAAWFGWATVTLSTPFLFHAFAVYPEAVASLIVLVGVSPLIAPAPWGGVRWALQGAALAALPWLHTRYAVLAGVLGLLGLATLLHQPRRLRLALAFLAVPALSAFGWFAFFRTIYGTFDPSAPYGGATQTALAHLPAGLVGLLVDQQFGILPYAPVYLVAALGLFVLVRRGRTQGEPARVSPRWFALALTAVMVPYLLTVTSFAMWWGGWSAPGRFFVPVALVLAVPAAAFWAWSPWPAARVIAVSLLTLGAFTSGVLAVVDRGGLLYEVRGAGALWLQWINSTLDVTLALPSIFRDGPLATLLLAAVWLAWFALAWLGVAWLVQRRSPGRGAVALATTLALGIAVIGASATAWRTAGAPTTSSGSVHLDLLRRFDASARPRGVSYQPHRIGPADEFLSDLVVVQPRDGEAPDGRLLSYARVPAGHYRLRIETHADVADPIVIGVGRRRDAEVAVLNQDLQATRVFEHDIHLPTDVHSLVLYGHGTAQDHVSRAILQALQLPTRRERLTAGRALRARQYAHGIVYFLDDEAYMETPGFWVRGGRQADVVLSNPAAPSAFRVLLRNGPVENRVHVTAGDRTEIVPLAPAEERLMELPVAHGQSALLVRLTPEAGFRPAEVDPASTDQRWLGCWVELR